MKRYLTLTCAAALTTLMTGSVSAATVTLDLTASSTGSTADNVTIIQTPVGSGGGEPAIGQLTTDRTNQLGSFLAWCLDLGATVGFNQGNEYITTNTPFTNSLTLDSGARTRVMNVFNANYAAVGAATSNVLAAAFQLSLWEVLYDTDFDLAGGSFQAQGLNGDAASIDSTAAGFLSAAQGWTGANLYQVTFLQSTSTPRQQNLVFAAPVPLPAAGLMLLGALGGIAGLRRRRSTRA